MRLHFRLPDGSSEQGKVCGNMDDGGRGTCTNENCVDEVICYTCDWDEDDELMLLVNGSVCVAKECENFLSNTFKWNRRECERESATMPWQL